MAVTGCWIDGPEIHQIITEDGAMTVGKHGCVRLEKTEKNGEFCMLPYVRVWDESGPVAEFIQHQLKAVYFERAEP